MGIINNRRLMKHADSSRHLLWKYGGVPAIDANTWDAFSFGIDSISVNIDDIRRLTIARDVFNKNKFEVNMGYGRQYVCPIEWWHEEGISQAERDKTKEKNKTSKGKQAVHLGTQEVRMETLFPIR